MKNKTIWLINSYGPIEGEVWREYSFNQFGKYLSNNGYNVIWWTANYSHHFKKYRSKGWEDIEVNPNFLIRLVPTTMYKKNFGIGRLLKDIIFSTNAYHEFKKYVIPDIILTNNTPLQMGYPDFKYAKKYGIPIIADQMDLWPEFIEQVLGRPFDKIAHFLFTPVYMTRKKNYDSLDGCIALGKNYLNKMIEISPSLINKPTALIYNGIDVEEFRKKMVNSKQDGTIKLIFAGTLGPSYDVNNILKCAKFFENNGTDNIHFFIAGSGPLENEVKSLENNLNNLTFLGKLLPKELISIYSICDVGLATYSKGSNVDMPDKFYDYTAAGLITINSLKGEISQYINDYKCGYNYDGGNFDSLKDTILKVINSNNFNEYKENAYILGMKFDKNIQNKKLLDLIDSVLDSNCYQIK